MVESVVRSEARRIGLGSILATAALTMTAAAALGQGLPQPRTFKPLNSYTAETLLRRAGEQAKQEQWAEAIDLYQKVIAQHANAVALVPKGDPVADATGTSELFVDARQHAQARLAALPPEGRALYRSRVDAQAERWFRQGLADRDRAPLRKIVDQLFCSSWGDNALDLLGDMAFQDGQFAEALANYRRIVPDANGPGVTGLVHPDPDVDLARVAAKKLLCREAIGTEPPSAADVKEFARTYPESKGSLAGRDGPLARNLAEALAADHLALPPQSDGRWPTFAGAPSRTRIAPGPIDIGQFQWRVKLDPPPPSRNMPPQRAFIGGGMGGGGGMPSAEIALPFHPIVLGDQVVVCDERRIHAYHLNARPEGGGADGAGGSDDPFYWDQPLRGAFAPPAAGQSGGGSPRYTLTAYGDRIYARLGPSGKSASTIVAVRHTGDIEGKRIWEKVSNQIPLPRPRPDAQARYSANFEGSPVADDHSVYVAMSDAANEINAYVACLDAETGALKWIRHLGSAPGNDPNLGMGMGMGMMPGSGAEIGNRLLSLDGQTIYYQTNLGAVAALDCETGAIKWLATYPGRDRNGVSVSRESNPAVVHDGLVMVAPDDSVPLMAFDAATGRLAWKTSPAAHTEKVVHLLGVAKGRLIATGDRVYSFSLKDGALMKAWPDGPSGFEAYGRGLLAGDAIYWPTKADIHVLDAATGDPGDHAPIRLLQHHGQGGGNLAVGDGFLVVAQRDGLVVFAQNSRLIDRFRQEIARAPDRAASYFQLARVAEATGQEELALTNLEETGRRAKPSDTIDGQPLIDEARSKQYKLLVRLADKASRKADWAEASRRLEGAAKVARSDRDRLSARLRLASAQTKAGNPEAAVVTFQEILGNAKLRAQTVANDERWTVRADLFIGDELARILRDGGPGLYAEFDRQAEALLERGRREKSARDLEEVGRAYPAARVAGDALWALASLREEENRPADAARAYKQLAAISTTDARRVKALLGLARAYQAQGLILPARDLLARVQVKYNDLRLDDPPPGGTVGSLVAEKLARPPFDKLGGDRSEPGFSVPLSRLWERRWDSPVHPLAAEGVPPSPSAVRVFVVEGTAIRPVDPLTGTAAWSFTMEDEPIWAGYLGDRLIAASATRIVALDPLGKAKWRYPEDAAKAAHPVTNPFAPARGAPNDRRDAPIGRLHGFRAVGGRLFFLRGDRELIALDGENGGTDWTFAPPGGGLNSNYCAGPRRLVVQVAAPEAMVVLDTETGRRREFARTAQEKADEPAQPWARPPVLIDDDHICVDVDPRTVAMLDLTTGKRAWTSRVTSASLPRNGPPRILGDSSRLLVVYEGNELIRIDPATGRQMWTRSLGLEDLSGSPDAFALDGDRFYCATGGKLSALNLNDGEPLWSRPLIGPDEGWSVALSERYVAAYPSPSRSNDGPLDGLPLVVCRRDDGVMVQRLSFPSTVSRLTVRLLPRGAMVATQAGAWALGELKVVDGPPPPR